MSKLKSIWNWFKDTNISLFLQCIVLMVMMFVVIVFYAVVIPLCAIFVLPFISIKHWGDPADAFTEKGQLRFAWCPVFKDLWNGEFEVYFLTWVRKRHRLGTYPFSTYSKAEPPKIPAKQG